MWHTVLDTRERRKPLFSAVIAVYNVSQYLPQFLASIGHQKIGRENVEFIFIDDCSSDQSLSIVQEWAANQPNILVIAKENNSGAADARNIGYTQARGMWVTSTDPDDVLASDYFSKVAAFAHSNPQADILTTRVLILDDHTGLVKATHPLDYKYRDGDRVVSLAAEPTAFQMGATAFLQKTVLKRLGLGFDARVRPSFEDGHFIARYLLALDNPQMGIVSSAEYYYRQRNDGGSLIKSSWDRDEKYTDLFTYGYLDVLQQAEAARRSVPRWLENAILYDLSWFFTEGVNPRGKVSSMVADGALRRQFLDNLAQAFSYISPAAVCEFRIRQLPRGLMESIIAHYYSDEISGVRNDTSVFTKARPQDSPHTAGNAQHVYARYIFGEIFAYETVFNSAATGRVLAGDSFLDYREPAPIALYSERLFRVTGERSVIAGAGAFLQRVYCANRGESVKQQIEKAGRSGAFVASKFPKLIRRIALRLAFQVVEAGDKLRNKPSRYQDAWLIVDRMSGANDNAEHFYRYLSSINAPENYFFMIGRKASDRRRLKDAGFRLLPTNVLSVASAITHSQVIIASDWAAADLTYTWNLRLRAGGKPIVFLQHGITTNDISNWLNGIGISLLVSTLQQEHEYFTSSDSPFRFSEDNVIRVGMPRYDRLRALAARKDTKNREFAAGSPCVVTIMPTWRNSLREELMALPEGEQRNAAFKETQLYKQWNELLTDLSLGTLMEQGTLKVYFVSHPNMADFLSTYHLGGGVTAIDIRDADFQKVLAESDLFITDYSSAAFDAAIAGCDITYFQFDKDEFFGGQQAMRPGWFDFERDGYGPVLDTKAAVTVFIGDYAHNKPVEVEYRTRLEQLRESLPQDSCKHLYNEIKRRFS